MATRKAISKKIRFEVFKRDFFTCAYCGSKPPKVVLEVDHITPVCAGGDNSIDNLITSCFECNRGKAGVVLSSVPESLSKKAARIKESELQLSEYRKILAAKDARIERDAWDVVHALCGDDINSIRTDYFKSIKKFNELIGKEENMNSAEIAFFKWIEIKGMNEEKRFKYYCAVCWNKSKEVSNGQG
jgi:hypothetical protein